MNPNEVTSQPPARRIVDTFYWGNTWNFIWSEWIGGKIGIWYII